MVTINVSPAASVPVLTVAATLVVIAPVIATVTVTGEATKLIAEEAT